MRFIKRLMEIKEEQLRLETHKHINDLYMCDRLDDILKLMKDNNGNKTRSKHKNS